MKPLQIKSYPVHHFKQSLVVGGETPPLLQVARHYARELGNKAFDNLNMLPYVYMTAGITEALDWILPRQNTVAHANDYRYVFGYKNVTTSDHVDKPKLRYVSYPFAHDGVFHTHCAEPESLFLDCAYLFASDMTHERLLPRNVEYVAFGLSKSHNLFDARIGCLFSKHPVYPQHILQYDYGYGSSLHRHVLSKVLGDEPNILYQQFKNQFSDLYRLNGLTEGNTNLFALDKDKNRIPWYTLNGN